MQDMLAWLGKYWLEVLMSFVVAGLTAAVKHMSNKIKKFKKDEAAEKSALLALLDNNMGQIFDKCELKGGATREESRRYERLYTSYTALGGNGVVTAEHARFQKLPITDGN